MLTLPHPCTHRIQRLYERNTEPFLYGTENFLHAHSFAISWIYFLVLVEGPIKNHAMKSNFSGLSQPQVLHR